ncbi:T9SS type B sorting domain-containing protein [Flavobacterium sp. Sd200]|uniref:T9SS type B sorting domain-containing protein n=1 Tax=Flavobacterium sp. Sd200 TaxID=2692211 RepID=UPI00136D5741|nr:T9SS type B sorting domain-containing protein [Flavobacterium sp. Sd200]MXN92997.1 T9SS type B sorting domain-containing protein [Flavobacterium sp. Sd200]
MKFRLLIFFVLINTLCNAQYAIKHYIAPSPWQYWSFANEIVVSTKESGNVSVSLYKSDGTAITTLTVTAAAPVSYRFTGTASALPRNTMGLTYNDRGLIVEATAPVLVNLRNIASDAPGTSNSNIKGNASLVSFGNEGIGNQFRLGYYRSSFTGLSSGGPVFSVMAIENGTSVTINGVALATLNEGQSRIFTAPMGALLEADKPVVANVGSYGDTPQACAGNGEDATVDQIAPINVLGTQYMVVRGSGTAGTGPDHPEQTTIVATEPGTTVQVRNYNAAGQQLGTPRTYNLANGGDFQSIHHGDGINQYSSTFMVANKPVIVYSGTAVNCETDISTVLPIGGCSGTTNIITKKFIDYAGNNLPYFAFTIIESATEPVLLNSQGLETLTGLPRVRIGTTGFYMLRFDNDAIGNPQDITITSNARLTTSIVQQGDGFSMSGFFSAFSDSPEPPTRVSSSDPCIATLSTTPGLAPYQWYLDGVLISGEDTDTLQTSQSGNYSVVGTRPCGITLPSAPVYVSVAGCSNLKVEKQVLSINGNQAVFEVKALNTGGTDDTNVQVTDLLPNGYQYVSSTVTSGTYDPVTGLWNIGNLAAGAAATLMVTVTINSTGNNVNIATILGTNVDINPTDNTAQAIAQISELQLTKIAQQPVYHNVGEVVVYDLVLTNSGQTTITNITVTDANADAGTVMPSIIATLAPGQSVTISASHTVTAADALVGNVTNQAAAQGNNPSGTVVSTVSDDPSTTTPDDATITPVLLRSADIVTVKTNNQTTYQAGTSTTYTITVTNNGPDDATNITITDAIPVGITVMNWTGNGASGNGILNNNIPLLTAGTSVTYQVSVDIPQNFTGNLVNTVVVVSPDVTDPDPTCLQCIDTDTPCATPVIQNPSNLVVCDDAVADGLTRVNLTDKNAEITLSNPDLEVTYYLDNTQLQLGNAISNPQGFDITTPFLQTVVAEVVNRLTGCKIQTQLTIVVDSKPQPLTYLEKHLCQTSNDLYDLTAYEQEILNNQTGIIVSGYFTSLADANANTNAIVSENAYRITSSTQTLYVRSENSAGCHAVTELKLNISGVITLNLPNQYNLCLDVNGNVMAPVQINTGLPATQYSFKWYKDGALLPSAEPFINVSQQGSYRVEVTNNLGCSGIAATVSVGVSAGPLSLTARVTTGYFSDNPTVVAFAGGSRNFVFWMDNGQEQSSTTFTNVSAGLHTVYVRDLGGCGNILSFDVLVIDYPKFFTPNGDGINDYWNIRGLPQNSNAIIYIFDRYGKLITSILPRNTWGWDGTLNDRPLPATDYWFKIIYFENQQQKEFKAHFSLLR